MVEKVNKKARDLRNKQKKYGRTALYIPRYTHSMKMIDTRERFEQYRASVADVLTKDWRKRANKNMRDQFADNLINSFGKDAAGPIIEKMKTLKDRELKAVFEKSKYIESIFYESKTEGFGDFVSSTVKEIYLLFGIPTRELK